MLTRVGAALVDFSLAAFTAIARRTMANELVDAILTGSVDARVRCALIDIARTSNSVVTCRALASECVW